MYIVGYLISYMKKKSRTMPQMFSDIDKNEDGYLSKDEMINVFKK
jgi:Ca2+-binding EF-hand superfamily protein